MDDERKFVLLNEVDEAQEESYEKTQKLIAKKLVSRLVHNIEYRDVGVNTYDSVTDSFVKEIELQKVTIVESDK